MTKCFCYCDRCKGRIDCGRVKLVMECGPTPPPWPVDAASGRATINLCALCLHALTEWLARPEAMAI
jgi:hypothetical protein